MLGSSLCDYILAKGTITVPNTGTAAAPDSKNKKVILKNCTPFTDCISDINNKEINRAKDIDVVMPVYNLIEYSDNYFNNDAIIDVPDDPDSDPDPLINCEINILAWSGDSNQKLWQSKTKI